MAGVTITIASVEQIVQRIVSAGTVDPICVEGLDDGTYQIAQIVPGRLEMTTAATAKLELVEGNIYGVEFGSRLRTSAGSATPTASQVVAVNPTPATGSESESAGETTSPAESNGSNTLAVSGLIVLALAVILLGVLIFLVLRGQTR